MKFVEEGLPGRVCSHKETLPLPGKWKGGGSSGLSGEQPLPCPVKPTQKPVGQGAQLKLSAELSPSSELDMGGEVAKENHPNPT